MASVSDLGTHIKKMVCTPWAQKVRVALLLKLNPQILAIYSPMEMPYEERFLVSHYN